MKNKFTKVFMLVATLAFITPIASFAETTNPIVDHREAQAQKLVQRLEEIKAMDVKKMNKSEKKALRKEVKAIKKEMAAISGGVYLSIGAILLIALLLILLL